jgi:hypothetical protein
MKLDLNVAKNIEERKILIRITNKRTGELRATKPDNRGDLINGRAAYVWRNVMFYVSKNPKHWCMPITAEFYLGRDDWENRYEIIKVLDEFVDRIVNSFPKSEWYGIRRWHNAMVGV